MIMVVDGANMQVLRNAGKDAAPKLMPVEAQSQASSRTSALGTDRPGRAFQSATAGRSSSYETSDYHQVDEDAFAADAAERLETLLTKGVRGILVAAPRTLGIIRKHLDADTRQRLIAEIDKDYAQRSVADIVAMLEQHQN
jgi:protein required for attachment to host cells